MLYLDYDSFLDNPEGNDLKIDLETILTFALGSFVLRVIDIALQ